MDFKYYSGIFLLVSCFNVANGQSAVEGTSFVTAFPQLFVNHNMTSRLYLMTRSNLNVTARITSLPTSSYFFDETLEVSADEATVFRVDQRLQPPYGTVITDDGISVTATSPILVDALVGSPSNDDLHPLIPEGYLGTDYLAVSHTKWSHLTANFVLVVAQQDDTNVAVALNKLTDGETVTLDNVTYDHRDSLNVTLNRLQTLQLQTSSDLTGTRVSSSGPVAAYSGQNRTWIPGNGTCYSHLSDQLPPVPSLGRRFVLTATPDQVMGVFYRIVASRPLTSVTVRSNPVTTIRLLSAGDFHEYDASAGTHVYVTADQPVLVVQITKTQAQTTIGDPSMAVLAPLEQAESVYSFHHAVKAESLFFVFAVNETQKDGIRLNGQPLSEYNVTWNAVPDTDLAAGYVILTGVVQQLMTLSHVDGDAFSAHVNCRRRCESRSMPLTYGKPLAATADATSTSSTSGCIPTRQRSGDGVDNDCDGRVDEEVCGPAGGATDDDGDGFVDEDCASTAVRSSSFSSRQVRKRAQTVLRLSLPGRLACAVACMRQDACWGINFRSSPGTPLPSDPNCEVLSGPGGGMVAETGWSYFDSARQ